MGRLTAAALPVRLRGPIAVLCAQTGACPAAGLVSGVGRGLPPGREVDPEAGTFPYGGIESDATAELFGDRLADRKPESGPLGESVEFDKTFEDAFLIFGGDTDARVADVETNIPGKAAVSDRHRAFFCEF